MSKIEWTQQTWNPTIGCKEVSPGCTNCYAARMAHRLASIPGQAENYAGLTKKATSGKVVWTGVVKTLPERLQIPIQVKKPTTWFLDSMSDLFHADVPFEFIDRVFAVMALTPHHKYQVLTKRADRLVEWSQRQLARICTELDLMADDNEEMEEACAKASIDIIQGGWPLKNVWLGVSVENQKAADERISLLLQVPAEVHFLSCEPLLGPVDISDYFHDSNCLIKVIGDCTCAEPLEMHIDWVIAGGESGPGSRPMHPDWARSLRDQCKAAGVPFFFKQWGDWREYTHDDGDNARTIGRFDNDLFREGNIVFDHKRESVCMAKVGKKKAGRLLDGRLHDEFPE